MQSFLKGFRGCKLRGHNTSVGAWLEHLCNSQVRRWLTAELSIGVEGWRSQYSYEPP